MQRTYECQGCQAVNYTVESPGERERDSIGLFGPVFVKRNGMRAVYDRNELAKGLFPARGAFLEESVFREMVSNVHAQASAEREVTAQQIEDWALGYLKERNRVAYLRLLIDFGRILDDRQLKDFMEENGD